RGSRDLKDKTWRFSLLWLAAYGIFLSTWEPATLCYRITDIIPLGLIMASGLQSFRWPWQVLWSAAFLGTTLSVNAATRILPMHDPELNSVYQQTLTLSKITSPESLFVVEGGLHVIYLPYFAGRETWNASSLDAKRLAEEIGKQKKARPVYI